MVALIRETVNLCPPFDSHASEVDTPVQKGWRTIPPGRLCVYSVNGGEFRHEDAPEATRAVLALLLLGSGELLLFAGAEVKDRGT